MANTGPYAETEACVRETAAEEFAAHVLTVEGPNEWRVGKPGTGIYAFRVLCRPYMVAVWGDLGEWILRISARESLAWLRGSVRSLDYLLSKVQAGERLTFYAADAVAMLDDPETVESWGVDRVAKIREGIEWADPLTQEKWLEACRDADLDDPPLVEYPTSGALWLIESLRKFVALEAELPRVYNGPSPLALAVVDEIEAGKAPEDRRARPTAVPTVTRHRCLASGGSGTKASYYLTVEYPLLPHTEEKKTPAPRLVEPVVLDGFGDPIVADGVYLISDDRSRDNVIWWDPQSAGYTGSLDRAGRYTGQEAAAICRRARGVAPTNLFDNPVAWPEHRITGDLVSRIVDSGALLAAAMDARKEATRG